MKWHNIYKEIEKFKGYRYIKRFAIFPIKINNEYRWLETCYIRQAYRDGAYWKNECFINKEVYEKGRN